MSVEISSISECQALHQIQPPNQRLFYVHNAQTKTNEPFLSSQNRPSVRWWVVMLGAFSDTRLEARLLGAVLSFELAKGMFGGGLWILSPHSVTGKVALLSAYPSLIAYTWMALSIMVTPYFLMQLFGWGERHRAVLTRLACRANLASGVIWTYLAYLSKNLDYQNITTIFIANGVACIAMAAVLANGINSAQMRAKGGDQ